MEWNASRKRILETYLRFNYVRANRRVQPERGDGVR